MSGKRVPAKKVDHPKTQDVSTKAALRVARAHQVDTAQVQASPDGRPPLPEWNAEWDGAEASRSSPHSYSY